MPNSEQVTTVSNSEPTSEVKRHTIKMSLSRENGQTLFNFAIPEAIEKILKADDSAEVVDSQKWPGLSFYKVPAITKNDQYKELLNQYDLFDDYGQPLIKGNKFNIAWLRTKGGTGSIVLDATLGASESSMYIRNAVNFVREYYNSYYKPLNVKGEVIIEV